MSDEMTQYWEFQCRREGERSGNEEKERWLSLQLRAPSAYETWETNSHYLSGLKESSVPRGRQVSVKLGTTLESCVFCSD